MGQIYSGNPYSRLQVAFNISCSSQLVMVLQLLFQMQPMTTNRQMSTWWGKL